MRKNAWYYGPTPPAIGQKWKDCSARRVDHVKTLKVLSHELVDGREAWLCRVSYRLEETEWKTDEKHH
jgi:hypothetical protein